jgi:hypothetical protein
MTFERPDPLSIATETARGWSFQITPPELVFIAVNFQTRLQFENSEIVIECPFELGLSGEVYRLDPADRDTLGPLLRLYPASLVSADSGGGTLRLGFGNGATLLVPPDPRYEAWQINGPGNFLFVCTPGGEASVWR